MVGHTLLKDKQATYLYFLYGVAYNHAEDKQTKKTMHA